MPERLLGVILDHVLAKVPDIRAFFLNPNGFRPVTIIVTGQDGPTADAVAAHLAGQMRQLPEIANVVTTAALTRPEGILFFAVTMGHRLLRQQRYPWLALR